MGNSSSSNLAGSTRTTTSAGFVFKCYGSLAEANEKSREHCHCPKQFEVNFPFHLVPGFIILGLQKIPTYEELLVSNHLLKIEKSIQCQTSSGWGITGNWKGKSLQLLMIKNNEGKDVFIDNNEHKVIFFSHRWFSTSAPDNDQNEKLKKIQSIIRPSDLVWLDYMCIPQANQDTQSNAISSLPFYIGHSDELHILTFPGDNRKEYESRAFTNLELVCASIPLRTQSIAKAFIYAVKYSSLCLIIDDDNALKKDFPFRNPGNAALANENDRSKIRKVVDDVKEYCSNAVRNEYDQVGINDVDQYSKLLVILNAE